MFGVVGDDAARLLAAVLQRVQAERDEIRGIGHADHAEDAAFLAQLVVVGGVERMVERVTGEGIHVGRISGRASTGVT